MDVVNLVKGSFKAFTDNIMAYAVGILVTALGSFLIVTAPPLMFGLYYMGVKGARGEKVQIDDVFKGFSYFVKSWTYFIILGVIISLPFILGGVFLFLRNSALAMVGLGLMALGILWALVIGIMQIYAVPLIVSKGIGVVEGLKGSVNLVRRNLVSTVMLFIAVIVVSLLGIIPVAGTIVAEALTLLMVCKTALELKG